MQPGEFVLEPYIVFYSFSSDPILNADGSRLFFMSLGNPETRGGWYQIYLYSPDGKHRCLTDLKAATIWSNAVSPRGDKLVVVYDDGVNRDVHKIAIYGVDDGTRRDIVLPEKPTRIINSR
jgi:Tol biopolymer transport system component